MQVHATASQWECLDITVSPSGACAEYPGLDCWDEGRWNHLGLFGWLGHFCLSTLFLLVENDMFSR